MSMVPRSIGDAVQWVHRVLTEPHYASLSVRMADGGEIACGAGSPPPDGTVGETTVEHALEGYGQHLATATWHGGAAHPGEAAEQAIEAAVEQLSRVFTLHFELDGLSAELADSYESINLIHDLSEASTQVSTSQEMCGRLLEALTRQVRSRAGCILLGDPDSGEDWTVQAVFGESRGLSVGARIPCVGWLREDVAEGSGLLRDHVLEPFDADDPLRRFREENCQSLLAVPLRSGESQSYGGLLLFDRIGPDGKAGVFRSEDRKLAESVATQGTAMIRGMRMAEFSKEMEIGQRIQRSLLPSSVPQTDSVLVAGMCSMARRVGGDLYDAALGADGELRAVIADVSGHDLGAALLMASARAQFRMELRATGRPGEIVESINEALYQDLSSAGLFLTFFVVTYDADDGLVWYSGGGHNPLILIPAGSDQPRYLAAPGMPAGLAPSGEFPEESAPFGSGDLLLMYTDGLTEAMNPEGEMFGEERLAAALVRHRLLDPEALLARVESELQDFCQSPVLQDDGTALLLKGVGSHSPTRSRANESFPTMNS